MIIIIIISIITIFIIIIIINNILTWSLSIHSLKWGMRAADASINQWSAFLPSSVAAEKLNKKYTKTGKNELKSSKGLVKMLFRKCYEFIGVHVQVSRET